MKYSVDPIRLRQNVTDAMPVLEEMFKKNPEIPNIIDAWADKWLAAVPDLKKYAKDVNPLGELVGKMTKPGTVIGGGGLTKLTTMDPMLGLGIAVPMGFEIAMAHSLAHPQGWLKKLVFRDKGSVREALRPLAIPATTQTVNQRPYMNIRPGEQSGPEIQYLPTGE
jgi:hypothetical protein